ncbi:MAG: DUF932 domain-containing protein [Thermaurantimonas sp.]|uniref:DUF932 domain-containing protein n=1 Tax=Thermaurantimonas sp. TaxID=2681568 RepID=UPI00391C058F
MKGGITKEVFEEAEKQLQKLFFDVEFRKLMVCDSEGIFPVKNFKALVRKGTDKVFSVVSPEYTLITNNYAIKIGREIFSKLFNVNDVEKIRPYFVRYPETYSYCQIKLVHEDVNFNVFEQDTWLPFIYIANSYNKQFALNYEVGFVRSLCLNGVVFDKEIISIRLPHNQINKLNLENLRFDMYDQLKSNFINNIRKLRDFKVENKFVMPLVCKIFSLNFKSVNEHKNDDSFNSTSAEIKANNDEVKLNELKYVVNNLTNKYFREIGDNAYAVFNIVTDLVSNEQEGFRLLKKFNSISNSLLSQPGKWFEEFSEKISSPTFRLEDYLKNDN